MFLWFISGSPLPEMFAPCLRPRAFWPEKAYTILLENLPGPAYTRSVRPGVLPEWTASTSPDYPQTKSERSVMNTTCARQGTASELSSHRLIVLERHLPA